MSAPTRLPPCDLPRTVGSQRLQESVNNGHAIRNLPRAGAEMHLSVCRCEHAPPPEGLRSLGHLPPQEGRMDMRVRMRSVSRRFTVCAAVDPFEDVATLFDGFLLSAPLIPLLRVGLRRDCRLASPPLTPDFRRALSQSAGLKERAVSLGGEYIGVTGGSPLMRQRMSVRLAEVMSGGSTGKRTRVHVVHLGGFQS